MSKNVLLNLCLVFSLIVCAVAFSACGELKDGSYEEAGVIYNVSNHSAQIAGATGDVAEITIPTEYKGVKVVGIQDDAFKNSNITKISFEQKEYDSFFTIGEQAFMNSQIKSIENLPANSNLNENSLEGLKNLETITTYGQGEFSVVNNALVQTKNENSKYLRLIPASSQPQDNFVDGTYTVTGYTQIFDYALQYNKYITNVVICSDVMRIESYAFANINLSSVTFEDMDGKEVFVDGTAFTAHKDLKIFIPATTDYEMSSWLSYSKNFIYGHNWLVHPVGCDNDRQHCHGGRLGSTVPASYEGYSYSKNGNSASINANYTYNTTLPDYMLKTYDDMVQE